MLNMIQEVMFFCISCRATLRYYNIIVLYCTVIPVIVSTPCFYQASLATNRAHMMVSFVLLSNHHQSVKF